MIEEAVNEPKTRTGLKNRGKGLIQIVNSVLNSPAGEVFIYSNHGVYSKDSKENTTQGNFSSSIQSTLIMWRMPLNT